MPSKRRVASVTVFLLAGMVVNVLVAWSALAAADWAKMETTFAGIAGRWPRAAPARWPPPEQLMTKAGLGVVVLSSVTHLQQPPDHSEHYRIDLHALGWPLPAVRCESWMDFSIDGTRGSSTVTHRYDAQPDPSWWTNGAPVPMSRWGFGPQGWKRLPIRPAPAGFAANTALYAALVAGGVVRLGLRSTTPPPPARALPGLRLLPSGHQRRSVPGMRGGHWPSRRPDIDGGSAS
jgi:hypothetical protein